MSSFYITYVDQIVGIDLLLSLIVGHSAANAMARIGGFLCPFLVQENTPLWMIGSTMLLLHTISAFCVLRLPETGQRTLVYHDIHSIMI
jgi:hypothetical protein